MIVTSVTYAILIVDCLNKHFFQRNHLNGMARPKIELHWKWIPTDFALIRTDLRTLSSGLWPTGRVVNSKRQLLFQPTTKHNTQNNNNCAGPSLCLLRGKGQQVLKVGQCCCGHGAAALYGKFLHTTGVGCSPDKRATTLKYSRKSFFPATPANPAETEVPHVDDEIPFSILRIPEQLQNP